MYVPRDIRTESAAVAHTLDASNGLSSIKLTAVSRVYTRELHLLFETCCRFVRLLRTQIKWLNILVRHHYQTYVIGIRVQRYFVVARTKKLIEFCFVRFPIHDPVHVTTIHAHCPMSHWISSKRIRWWTKTFRHSSVNRFSYAPAPCKYQGTKHPLAAALACSRRIFRITSFLVSAIDSHKSSSMHKLKRPAVKRMTCYSSERVSHCETIFGK